jgi:hypothetical protein
MRVSLPTKIVRRAPDARVLARSLDEIVAEAWSRRHGAWTATTALNDARSRTGVRAATGELSSLAQALRETPHGDPETLRMCRDLLCDGFASPLYGGDVDALRHEAGRLRYRVLAGGLDG